MSRRAVLSRSPAVLIFALAVALLSSCRSGEQVGSETHFLRLCPDGTCAQGDQCVCGVCTVACDTLSACSDRLALDSVDTSGLNLVCRAPACASTKDQESAPGAVCDVVCQTDADCRGLGPSFGCELDASGANGACRTRAALRGPTAHDPCPGNTLEIPGGTLLDGQGMPHDIASFCLDASEVSVGNYTLCVSSMMPGCTAPAAGNYFVQGREQHPINDVTLEQASAFCSAIGARLPSAFEEQWAAQGGALQLIYPWGDALPSAADQPPRVCALATDSPDTCPVGGRAAGQDPWGVRDLAGNVAEIVTTAAGACVAGGSYAVTDPSELAANACPPYTAESLTIGFRCATDHP